MFDRSGYSLPGFAEYLNETSLRPPPFVRSCAGWMTIERPTGFSGGCRRHSCQTRQSPADAACSSGPHMRAPDGKDKTDV